MNIIGLINICRKYPVTVYCIIAFSITWGLKYLYAVVTSDNNLPAFNFSLIASYGPSLSAFILIALTQGKEGLGRTAKSMLNWRVGCRWLLIAALFEFIIFFTIAFLNKLRNAESIMLQDVSMLSGIFSLVLTFVFGLFRWGLAEEIGWRGWIFPHLQKCFSPFAASLFLAVLITLWHIHPKALADIAVSKEGTSIIGRYPEVVERLIISIPFVLVMTYVFNNTRGSLLVMMIFHSASNTSYFWIDENIGSVKTVFFKTSFLIALVIICIVFSILVIKQKKKVTMAETA